MLKKQIISFILIGIVNTIFGYTVYAIFLSIGFNYILSTLLATLLGILFNFKTIGKYVFDSHNNRLIFKFFSVYVIIYFVNILIIKTLKTYGYNDYIAGAFALPVSALLSFILNKYYVFKK